MTLFLLAVALPLPLDWLLGGAGRAALVRGYAGLKVHGLGVSATPRVILGEGGWLFLRPEAEANYLPADDPALDTRLDRWRAALLARRDWLAARGVRYLVVVAPEKQSVYPERLPAAERRRGPTPLDRLLAALPADVNWRVLDLRDPLTRARADGDVYLRTDTHWNDRGGRAAAAAVLSALADWFPGVTPPAPVAMTATREFRRGDLARLMGLDGAMPEQIPVAERLSARPHRDGVPGVVLFHDSFATAGGFAEELADHCGRLTLTRTYGFDQAVIARERPAVVVQEFAERVVQGLSPK